MGNWSDPFRQATRFLRVSITRDTRQGKKVSGGRFAAYKASYTEWLTRKGLLGGKKWLWLSGKMIGDMKTRVGRTRAQVGYWNKNKSQMLANVHHKGRKDGSIPARQWMDFRKGYAEHIIDSIVWPWLGKEVNRAGIGFRITA